MSLSPLPTLELFFTRPNARRSTPNDPHRLSPARNAGDIGLFFLVSFFLSLHIHPIGQGHRASDPLPLLHNIENPSHAPPRKSDTRRPSSASLSALYPSIMMSSSSGTPESWISSFCSLLGHEYFAEVSEEFIEDDFNLTGLQTQVAMYKEALEVK